MQGGDPNASRRRLLRGGLAAAPVLMTLVSRPVLAQRCTTPSGFVSANASTAGRGVDCIGQTRKFWLRASPSTWPSAYPTTTPFNQVFNSPPYTPYNGKTLLNVLSLYGNPPIDDVAHVIVAALLNAAAGLTPVLTITVVKNMWKEYITTGCCFSPSSAASWNHDELIDYLRTTQLQS